MSFVSKLPDEYRQRYEAIAAGWRAEFEPAGYQETRLVDILIQNDWLLVSGPPVDALALPTRIQQNEQRLLEAEALLCNGAGDEQEMEAKQRRKAAAERSFYRVWNALQGLRKELMRNEWMLAKMEHKLFQSEQENTKLRAENDVLRKEQESPPQAKARSAKKNGSAGQNETKAQRLFQGQKLETGCRSWGGLVCPSVNG